MIPLEGGSDATGGGEGGFDPPGGALIPLRGGGKGVALMPLGGGRMGRGGVDTPTLNLWGTNMAAPTLVTLKPPFLGSLPSDGSGDVVPVAVRGGPQLSCSPPPPTHTWGGFGSRVHFCFFQCGFIFFAAVRVGYVRREGNYSCWRERGGDGEGAAAAGGGEDLGKGGGGGRGLGCVSRRPFPLPLLLSIGAQGSRLGLEVGLHPNIGGFPPPSPSPSPPPFLRSHGVTWFPSPAKYSCMYGLKIPKFG